MTTNGTTTPFPMLPQKALSADILGLGEATHGNLLINAWRVLTIKYLIKKHGFRVLAPEDDVEYVERVFHEKLPNTYLAFIHPRQWNQHTIAETLGTFHVEIPRSALIIREARGALILPVRISFFPAEKGSIHHGRFCKQ